MQEFIKRLVRFIDLVAKYGGWALRTALCFKQFLLACLKCPIGEESNAQA